MKIAPGQKMFFTQSLMQWHANENDRSLPWKQEKDPYKIWLSEIILQQTRALQGKPYYLKFLQAFPTIKDMAAADDETVFRLWQGLGYYNRCKNMLATARYIAGELNGKFPDTYEAIVQLKGVGPYTAAAIASFAFGRPCAVVDGNVYRLLSRFLGIETPIDSTEGKNRFAAAAGELLDEHDSAAYNQAIMDLGATVCTPRQPLCGSCPLQKNCRAYKQGLVAELPVKSKKQGFKRRYFHYILFIVSGKIWLHKRLAKDIWQNLHEPFLVETASVLDGAALQKTEQYMSLNLGRRKLTYEGKLSQRLTHQLIETHFFSILLPGRLNLPLKDGFWVAFDDIDKYALPKTLVSFLEKKLYF